MDSVDEKISDIVGDIWNNTIIGLGIDLIPHSDMITELQTIRRDIWSVVKGRSNTLITAKLKQL